MPTVCSWKKIRMFQQDIAWSEKFLSTVSNLQQIGCTVANISRVKTLTLYCAMHTHKTIPQCDLEAWFSCAFRLDVFPLFSRRFFVLLQQTIWRQFFHSLKFYIRLKSDHSILSLTFALNAFVLVFSCWAMPNCDRAISIRTALLHIFVSFHIYNNSMFADIHILCECLSSLLLLARSLSFFFVFVLLRSIEHGILIKCV